MTAKIHSIEGLEQQLEQLRSENDALQTRINTDMDLDHIYKVATEELGMVYATVIRCYYMIKRKVSM